MAYPKTLSALPVWHSVFNQACIDSAAIFPNILTAGNLGKILANKNMIVSSINGGEQAQNFAQEVVEWRDIYIRSPLGTPAPSIPVPPAAQTVPLNTVVGIDAFTRLIISQLDADPNMTDAIRAAMGILPDPSDLGQVRIVSLIAQAGSEIAMRLGLAGYDAVAIYLKRAGVTTKIGISMRADFLDETPPLVAGQSESREYWVRGISNNVETGDISASGFVATTP